MVKQNIRSKRRSWCSSHPFIAWWLIIVVLIRIIKKSFRRHLIDFWGTSWEYYERGWSIDILMRISRRRWFCILYQKWKKVLGISEEISKQLGCYNQEAVSYIWCKRLRRQHPSKVNPPNLYRSLRGDKSYVGPTIKSSQQKITSSTVRIMIKKAFRIFVISNIFTIWNILLQEKKKNTPHSYKHFLLFSFIIYFFFIYSLNVSHLIRNSLFFLLSSSYKKKKFSNYVRMTSFKDKSTRPIWAPTQH